MVLTPVLRVLLVAVVLVAGSASRLAAQDVTDAPETLSQALEAVAAAASPPGTVTAGGLTRAETPLVTLEHGDPHGPADAGRRLVLVGGLDGDPLSARLVVDAARALTLESTRHPGWTVSAMPLANPDGLPLDAFPPTDGFFDHETRPDTRYVWRWVTYQAPDLVAVVSVGDTLEVTPADATSVPPESLVAALVDGIRGDAPGAVPAFAVSAPVDAAEALVDAVLAAAPGGPSPLRVGLSDRVAREPLDVARVLARRYPETPGMAYIPAVAWVHTWRLATLVDDDDLRQKVMREVGPWLAGERPIVGERISLAGVAGTMIFGELASSFVPRREAAQALALQGVALSAVEASPGRPEHGSGWSDDVFLGTAAATHAGEPGGLEAAVRLVLAYADRLQQPDGLFHHVEEAPTAWGRGNGFAALGVAEVLTALPDSHPRRDDLIGVHRRHLAAMREHQTPDGLWRQVVDLPGTYREASVTALTLTAMARGVRLGWLDDSYRPTIERAWLGLLSHVTEDGTLVDVCISTGAGPTRRHYLDRTAVNGADDRGGALALGAALEVHALREAR